MIMKILKYIPFIRIAAIVIAVSLFGYLQRGLICSFSALDIFDRFLVVISLLFIPTVYIYLLVTSYSKIEQNCKRRKCISDIVSDTPDIPTGICRLFQNMIHVGSCAIIGFISTLLITVAILCIFPTFKALTYILGIVGVIYGILSYHISRRVERSIRDSITDFREFLKVVTCILEDEITCTRRRIKKFVKYDHYSHDAPDCADLILLLWFPSYSLTKDFNGIGNNLDNILKEVKGLTCRTYLITAKNENEIIRFFDQKYRTEAKNYNENILHSYFKRLDNADRQSTKAIFDEMFADSNQSNIDKNLYHSLNNLYSLYNSAGLPFWSVIRQDNKQLMDRLIQLIWTPKKAAIVFMPPDYYTQDKGIYASNSPYKCSGFVTEDKFMIGMIRDIIQLQYGV